MDLVVRAPRFPRAGETILGGAFATFPGGKGANQAVAAARMGAGVSMVGRIGDDAYGPQMRSVLDREGIDTGRLLTTRGAATGVAVITVAEGGGNTIVVAPGANGALTAQDVEAARGTIEASDLVLMQLETPLEAVTRAAHIARGAGRTVVLNAAPAAVLPPDLLSLLDVLIVNETEAAIVAGAEDGEGEPPERLLPRLAGLGVPACLMTLGERGVLSSIDGAEDSTPAFSVGVIDTVGAGDAFCGAIAAAWPVGDPALRRTGAATALLLASGAGALATTRAGAIPSLPTLAEVSQLMRRMLK